MDLGILGGILIFVPMVLLLIGLIVYLAFTAGMVAGAIALIVGLSVTTGLILLILDDCFDW
jgi:hypothetical protein